jgi:hypothetical protein
LNSELSEAQNQHLAAAYGLLSLLFPLTESVPVDTSTSLLSAVCRFAALPPLKRDEAAEDLTTLVGKLQMVLTEHPQDEEILVRSGSFDLDAILQTPHAVDVLSCVGFLSDSSDDSHLHFSLRPGTDWVHRCK